jgi:sec-independent protein translocase protein TatA
VRLGAWEIAAILAVVLLIFGPSKLPSLGRGVGEFLRNLKRGVKGTDTELSKVREIGKHTTP